MVEPRYQELKSSEIPKPSKEAVTVAVISGEALGVKGGQASFIPYLEMCILDPERNHFVLIAGEPLREPVVQHAGIPVNVRTI